jgi:copper homeostasis protein
LLLSLPLTLNSATELSISAIRGGADRLELCANLANGGGTTPSLGLLTAVQNTTGDALIMVRLSNFWADVDVDARFWKAMVCPRTGDFVYSEEEISVMLGDIHVFKNCDVRGIVTRALTADGRVDVECMKRFATARACEPRHTSNH